jgi:class 3 adenylate cyclase
MPSSGSMLATAAPPVAASARATYLGIRAFRIVLSIASLAIPFAFFLYFVISGGLIRPQLVEGTAVMRFVNALVTPALRLSESVFTFRTVYQGWNFVLLGFGILGFVARQLVLLPVEKLEHWAKTQVVRAKVAAPAAITVAGTETRSGDRLSMLREYAEAKKMLFQEKRRLAFASIGLVGASQLKAGEDKLVVEHAFSEYRKFLERALNENKVWKFSWSAETVTAVFESPDQAMDAAKYILANMAWFNDGIHQLRTPFRVRCGINCGEVIFPDSKRVEEINDETLDLANALQEAASENVVWLTRDTLSLLRDQNGFRAMTMQQVSGHPVLEWQQTRAAGAAD